ncbi:MAG TPA: nitroreductase family protein [Candidatus Acidoferrales bacterium]|nr:nitroreductase family protein [Candidatus Acidoferrales bacterium]
MEFFTVLRERRSVRSYKSQAVEEEKLRKIFEAANMAPSAGNIQAYQVRVVRDEAKRRELARAAHNQGYIAEAPVCLVFFADAQRSTEKYGKRGAELYSVQDATIAGSFAMLAAVDLGLATVWIGDFDEKKVQQILQTQDLRPVVIFSLGYAAEQPSPSTRRAIEEIFSGDYPQTD